VLQPSSECAATALAIAWDICQRVRFGDQLADDAPEIAKKRAELVAEIAATLLAGTSPEAVVPKIR